MFFSQNRLARPFPLMIQKGWINLNIKFMIFWIQGWIRCTIVFLPFRNKYSSKVSVIQSNIDYHHDNNHVEKEVEIKGYLNCHLCLNAKTQMEHTEPDASYTVIIIPNQIVNEGGDKCKCKCRFEFIINEDCTLVVPINPGLLLTYSGYMLTHRQQLFKENESSVPFINLVAYNSKCLFSNLMESFRRDIEMDKKMSHKKKSKIRL